MEKDLKKDDLINKLVSKHGNQAGKLLFRVVRSADYHQSIQDLVAYTGLSFDEVCERVALKTGQPHHFVDEYRWENPRSPNELNWFYRACRGYLFGNASRPSWEAMKVLKHPANSPVLDFGGGIGQNSLALAEQGFEVSYFDVSVMQADFVRFRAALHKVKVHALDPFYNGRFNYLECIPKGFRAMLLQDVLEHIPRYPVVLAALVERLQPGGLLLEYSPFNGKPQGKVVPKHSPVHIAEHTPLPKLMADLRMAKTDLAPYPATAWRKEGP